SVAGSTRGFISWRSRACGMRTCWVYGARTTNTPRRRRPSPGSSRWGRRNRIARSRRWSPTRRSMRCGCAVRTSRASKTSKRSRTRSRAGGAVLNAMCCHSSLWVRLLWTKPGASLGSIHPARVTGHVASLKWSRPAYAKRLQQQMGKDVDYTKAPSEDFASVVIEFETDDGATVIGEATTSWSFVGAGLRLSAELLGPEYSMSWNTLDSGLKLFFSREVKGKTGEDLVEKQ